MYRAVVLTTLVILMVAVAGVSVAQDGRIFAGQPNGEEPSGSTESSTPELTSLEDTAPEDTTTSQPPGASSEEEGRQDIPEPTVITELTVVPEPTVVEPEKPAAAPAREEAPTPATNGVGNPDDGGRAIGKPEHAVKASEPAAGSADMGRHGNGGPVELGNEAEPGGGIGERKATLCHKGNITLTVGVPALDAHLRHGDASGACEGGVSGPEPSGEAMGPEAATNGEGGGGGQGEVVLCHKNKSLTVDAPARAAHLGHGDSLGACP